MIAIKMQLDDGTWLDTLSFVAPPHVGEYIELRGGVYIVRSVKHCPMRDVTSSAMIELYVERT